MYGTYMTLKIINSRGAGVYLLEKYRYTPFFYTTLEYTLCGGYLSHGQQGYVVILDSYCHMLHLCVGVYATYVCLCISTLIYFGYQRLSFLMGRTTSLWLSRIGRITSLKNCKVAREQGNSFTVFLFNS